ncbi:MAG: polysaccharide biosynthesis/export family protein [Candidatus Omnitrophica bacterium]|nr:polysaccharide biosynthesis/export family protein [Candidatus Omnitrophota bacterium]
MKRKESILEILGIVFLFCFFLASPLFAETTAEILTREHQEKVLKKKTQGAESTSLPSQYQEEEQLIGRQIEVIIGNEDVRYRITSGDLLTIAYRDRADDKRGVYKVSEEGEIFFPLVGALKVGGLSRGEARELLNQALAKYIRYPKVDVRINIEGRFMVVGAVGSPGVYSVESNLSVLEAILKAGGYDGNANLKSVLLLRGGIDKPEITRLNVLKMIKKGDRSDNLLLKPGDLVYVPKSFIYHLENFASFLTDRLVEYYTVGGKPPLVQFNKGGNKESD